MSLTQDEGHMGYLYTMETHCIPRFPGRVGVSCFICDKGRSMTPFCTKHRDCFHKLSLTTKVELIKLCDNYPDDIPGVIECMRKFVRDENKERKDAEMIELLSKAAQSTAAATAEYNKKIDHNINILKSLGLGVFPTSK